MRSGQRSPGAFCTPCTCAGGGGPGQASWLRGPGRGLACAPFQGLTPSSSGSSAFAFHMKMFLQQTRMPAFLWSQSDVFNYIGQNPRRLFPWLQPVSERYLEPPSYPRTRAVSAPLPPALTDFSGPRAKLTPTWQPRRVPSCACPPSLPSVHPPRGRAGSPISGPGAFLRLSQGSVATGQSPGLEVGAVPAPQSVWEPPRVGSREQSRTRGRSFPPRVQSGAEHRSEGNPSPRDVLLRVRTVGLWSGEPQEPSGDTFPSPLCPTPSPLHRTCLSECQMP